ncbi:class I SAM-dependent methyltransferase [uncultured Cohaesibacter sp.]|uniref:class I SAM-dependent methyltransferase n=1 Tax=uncultured Cohaesibacter sp. TaxID=1002546 RepID=UPI0029C65CBD|nr:class I SAM-dependent methyltransferase [uncultured Cohaesibacter sp.]
MDELSNMCLKHNMPRYQINAFSNFLCDTVFDGKDVLEVGGSALPRELTLNFLNAKSWTCVDILDEGSYQKDKYNDHYKNEFVYKLSEAHPSHIENDYTIYDGNIENASKLEFRKFDIIVSITSFEHILAMPQALIQMKALLKEGGVILTHHGPVWSCFCGHHAWISQTLNFNSEGIIPDFAHLLYRPPEFYRIMESRIGSELAGQLMLQVYNEPRVNRYFYEDYISFFENSGFTKVEYSPYFEREVSAELLTRLMELHPGYQNFSAYGMYAKLTK